MTNNQNSPEDLSPLGMGHAPAKDPLKGFNGMVSATLVLEAMSIFLGLLDRPLAFVQSYVFDGLDFLTGYIDILARAIIR